jgi:hypothetical protein
MAKKKVGDTRGYATSNAYSSRPKHLRTSSKPVGGKAKKQVQVSKSAQDEITSLMDELKESLRRGDVDAGGNQPLDFAVDDKKMIKKIANLVRLDYSIGTEVLPSTLTLCSHTI